MNYVKDDGEDKENSESSFGYIAGMVIGAVIVAAVLSIVVAITIKLNRWILG